MEKKNSKEKPYKGIKAVGIEESTPEENNAIIAKIESLNEMSAPERVVLDAVTFSQNVEKVKRGNKADKTNNSEE